jgi:hypothetical protein
MKNVDDIGGQALVGENAKYEIRNTKYEANSKVRNSNPAPIKHMLTPNTCGTSVQDKIAADTVVQPVPLVSKFGRGDYQKRCRGGK